MRQMFNLIARFNRDERGAFALIFGLVAVVLIAFGGAVVDYVAMEQVRNRGQIALDAATLALQPEIFKTPVNITDIKDRAEDLLLDRLGEQSGVTATLLTPIVDVASGTLTLEAEMSVPTVFVTLVGVHSLDPYIKSQATRRLLSVEVAMVLDNSGSMGQRSKMSNLKIAACNAVNILFYDRDGLGCEIPYGVTKNDNVKISVVPFTALVNIGTQFKNELWLDWTSASQVAAFGKILNFDDDDDEDTAFLGPMDRRTLFSETNTSWQGCIEARVSPYDTTDDAPDSPERKFIPLFSPDTVYNSSNYLSDTGGSCQVKTCTVTSDVSNCYEDRRGNWTCYSSSNDSYVKREGSKTTNMRSSSCLPSNPILTSTSENLSYRNGSYRGTQTKVYSLLTERELQDRMCKYTGTRVSSSQTNDNCPSAKLLPLTDQPKSVLDSIDAMVANGNTNIQQGTVWGMHALTSGEPLTEAKAAAPGQVSKVLIVMTDGENYPDLTSDSDMNGSSYFSWGFRYDGRLGPKSDINTRGKLTNVMDDRTVAACEYARNDRDIVVYTIGLGSDSGTKAMLTKCASDEDHAYFPENASDLNGVFRAIADKLAALRLSQ